MKVGQFLIKEQQLKEILGLSNNTVITDIKFNQVNGEIEIITRSLNENDAWINQGEQGRRKVFAISKNIIDESFYFKVD